MRATSLQVQGSPQCGRSIRSAAEQLFIQKRRNEHVFGFLQNVEYGRCPHVLCEGQPVLPVGQSDVPRVSTVKVNGMLDTAQCCLRGSAHRNASCDAACL